MNAAFERYKVQRLIQTQGQVFSFQEATLNEFNEPVPTGRTVPLPGVYHETQGYVSLKSDDGGTVKTKPDSQILCLWESAQELKTGMLVKIQNKDYHLVDIRDIENFGVVCDLSLELILHG